jgi:hypothetical protein
MDVGPGPPEDCQTLDYMCSGREVVDANQETPKSTICEVDRCPEEENMEKGLNDVPICPDGTGEAKPRTLSTKVDACQPSSSKLELEDQDASPTPSARRTVHRAKATTHIDEMRSTTPREECPTNFAPSPTQLLRSLRTRWRRRWRNLIFVPHNATNHHNTISIDHHKFRDLTRAASRGGGDPSIARWK